MNDYKTHLTALKKQYKQSKNKRVVRALKESLRLLKDYMDRKYPDGYRP